MRKVRKAVFPVAGLGTRFLPATKAIPKEMLTVVDRPVIQYVVDEAREAGIEHFIFVTGRNKGVIEDHFDIQFELYDTLEQRGKTEQLERLRALQPSPGQTSFTRQQQPLGLGHAVWCARELIGDEPFALLLPDMIMHSEESCLKGMVDLYEKSGGNVVAVQECDPAEAHKYGIVAKGADVGGADVGAGFEITAMVEKPAKGTAPSNLYINGRYILQPEIFALLEKQERGAGGDAGIAVHPPGQAGLAAHDEIVAAAGIVAPVEPGHGAACQVGAQLALEREVAGIEQRAGLAGRGRGFDRRAGGQAQRRAAHGRPGDIADERKARHVVEARIVGPLRQPAGGYLAVQLLAEIEGDAAAQGVAVGGAGIAAAVERLVVDAAADLRLDEGRERRRDGVAGAQRRGRQRRIAVALRDDGAVGEFGVVEGFARQRPGQGEAQRSGVLRQARAGVERVAQRLLDGTGDGAGRRGRFGVGAVACGDEGRQFVGEVEVDAAGDAAVDLVDPVAGQRLAVTAVDQSDCASSRSAVSEKTEARPPGALPAFEVQPMPCSSCGRRTKVPARMPIGA
jgi:UTP--glucose-1-phosphate uridylyltransferase